MLALKYLDLATSSINNPIVIFSKSFLLGDIDVVLGSCTTESSEVSSTSSLITEVRPSSRSLI